MEIVVYGAGALGSLIGGVLAQAHSVTLVGRDPHMSAIAESGLSIIGETTAQVTPKVRTDGTGLNAELAIVAVKAFDTAAAATELATGSYRSVLSLQNGLDNESQLAAQLSDTAILAGTTTYGATIERPGVVRHAGSGTVTLGAPDGGTARNATRVAAAFEAAGLHTTVSKTMPVQQWLKLAVNVGINPLTAILDVSNGTLNTPPLRSTAIRAARETARVAQACSVDLETTTAVDAVTDTIVATATNTSSMRQDCQAGKPTEVDAITGVVCRHADSHNVAIPTVQTLDSMVRTVDDHAPVNYRLNRRNTTV